MTGHDRVRTQYRRFAENECKDDSDLYDSLSHVVADDNDLVEFSTQMPVPQPNLFFAAAIAVARARERSLHRGDLVADLPALLAQVPRDATLVVFHCAVLVDVDEEARRQFADILAEESRQRDIVWISNEAPTVVPEMTALAPQVKAPRFLLGRTRFVMQHG